MKTNFGLLFGILLIPTIAVGAAPGSVTSQKGMVVCVSPPAAEVGAAILKEGGNAVDAAIAVGFAQAVTWPEAGNIGGGGFMLIHPGDQRPPIVIDYREMAPKAATETMFAQGFSYQSILTSGVPGTVRGFELAHKKFGKLPWKQVVAPSVKLAKDGLIVNKALAGRLNGVIADPKTTHEEFRRIYSQDNGKTPWKSGDILKQPDLAKTLSLIAEQGADAFYTGTIAELIAKEMKASDGLVTLSDLQKYQAIERQPIHGTYRGYDVYGAPPPSSGGITLLQMLNMLEPFDVNKHTWSSAETTHLVAEVMRRAYCERAKYLGDPAFAKIPTNLTNKDYAKQLMKSFDPNKATSSATLAPEIILPKESDQTTHYSIIDADGMAVSNTYTLENAFGCRVVVRGAGFILNNEMTDFNHKPSYTNRSGAIGTKPNLVSPGKRMLSSMSPTILAKDGKVFLVTGSPGGRTIINTVLCIILNVVDYQQTIQDAVNAPRIHQQWFPESISIENQKDSNQLFAQLKQLGHKVIVRGQGDGHSIWVDPKTGIRYGAADTRLDGKAIGQK